MNCMEIIKTEKENIVAINNKEIVWSFHLVKKFVESRDLDNEMVCCLADYAVDEMVETLKENYGWDFTNEERFKLANDLYVAIK